MSNELEECKLSQRKGIWELVRLNREAHPDMPVGEIDALVGEKMGLATVTIRDYRLDMEKVLNKKNVEDSSTFTTAGQMKDHILARVSPEKRQAVIAEAKKEGGRLTAKKLETAAVKVGAKRPVKPRANPFAEENLERVRPEDFKSNSKQSKYFMQIDSGIDQFFLSINEIQKKFHTLLPKEKIKIIDSLKEAEASLSSVISKLEGKV